MMMMINHPFITVPPTLPRQVFPFGGCAQRGHKQHHYTVVCFSLEFGQQCSVNQYGFNVSRVLCNCEGQQDSILQQHLAGYEEGSLDWQFGLRIQGSDNDGYTISNHEGSWRTGQCSTYSTMFSTYLYCVLTRSHHNFGVAWERGYGSPGNVSDSSTSSRWDDRLRATPTVQ